MSSETPTDPGGVPIPSTTGIVGKAGKQPLPIWLDPDRTGVAVYDRKVVRDAVVDGLFWIAGALAPKNAYVLLVQGYRDQIKALIERGST